MHWISEQQTRSLILNNFKISRIHSFHVFFVVFLQSVWLCPVIESLRGTEVVDVVAVISKEYCSWGPLHWGKGQTAAWGTVTGGDQLKVSWWEKSLEGLRTACHCHYSFVKIKSISCCRSALVQITLLILVGQTIIYVFHRSFKQDSVEII